MIKLNKNNGNIDFDSYTISPKENTHDLMIKFNGFVQSIGFSVLNRNVLRIDVPTCENIFAVSFLNDKITNIKIISKGDEYEGGEGIDRILRELGGVKSYLWGTVRIFNDDKAGYSCSIVEYL
ncbi:hypothetical protein [Flavobacterium sp.]|uniref:hypothetical protein n=1 Tax=Flavobacterium sp. TaxID=239 RepID=UPI003A8FA465